MPVRFEQGMAAFAPQLPVLVAYSGGADSSALLHACVRRWPGQVHALHVHHGLQPAADSFAAHCTQVCQALGVPVVVERVQAAHQPGESPEEAARRARYGAISAFVQSRRDLFAIKTVALAQHADDQAETLLLALSRGAGVPGLASMPAYWVRDGVAWQRPLLAVAASEIRRWLAAEGLPFVEDPSNTDTRFTRNRIRSGLLPALDGVFPAFRDTFGRSARHAAQAAALLREMAAEDLVKLGTPPSIGGLRALSTARMANVLRHWLLSAHGNTPSTAQLDELVRQLQACSTRGHQIGIRVGQGVVRRQGPHIVWTSA